MAGLSVAHTARELRERFNQTEIRQLIQELISCDVAVSEASGSTGTSRLESKRVALSGGCTNSCLCAPMDPALWSDLPDELLQHVFARLPFVKISELARLSKKWNRKFVLPEEPEFMRACSEASPRMLAIIAAEVGNPGSLFVRVFDTTANRWYSSLQPIGYATMCAGDGGLVCSVSTFIEKGEKPFEVIVFNPLTRVWTELPHHGRCNLQPRMVQLVMDEDTKCYKVILVGEEEHGAGNMIAEMYCSKTEEWSSAEAFPGLIFGCLFRWKHIYRYASLNGPPCLGPGAYDCARRQLHEFDVQTNPCRQLHDFNMESNPRREIYVVSCALVKDHLFVLHQVPVYILRRYGISEYQFQVENGQPKWVKLRNHECGQFKYVPSRTYYEMKLYACKGFLLLEAANEENYGFEHKPTWLYDLSTTKWQKVPAIPDARNHPEYVFGNYDAMFELRWDAVP
jgi:hypothetical protein